MDTWRFLTETDPDLDRHHHRLCEYGRYGAMEHRVMFVVGIAMLIRVSLDRKSGLPPHGTRPPSQTTCREWANGELSR